MAKVAVLLAAYNGEKYIKELLESLDRQTMQDFHCYIHDDESKDGTVAVIKDFIINKENFELIEGPRAGTPADNFLFLLEQIQDEDYIMFCDQDDVWLDNKISVLVEKISNQDIKIPQVVFSDLIVVDSELKTIEPSYFRYEARNIHNIDFNHIIKKNVAPGCGMIINREMKELLLMNKGLAYFTLHDWAIMILAAVQGEALVCEEGLVLYRQHEYNIVGARNKTGIEQFYKQMLQLMSLKKFRYIKESVMLEKDIIRYILADMQQIREPQVELSRYKGILANSKWIRMKSYVRVNKGFGWHKFIRALFI